MLGVRPWTRHVRMAGLTNLLLGVLLIRWPMEQPVSLGERYLQRDFLLECSFRSDTCL